MRGNGSAVIRRLANAVLVGVGVLFSWSVEAGQPAGSSAGPEAAEALLTQYCVACHNDVRAEQGTVPVSFSHLDPADLAPHTAVWEQMVRKLRLGMMPPAGRPRPPALARRVSARLCRSRPAAPAAWRWRRRAASGRAGCPTRRR